MAGDPPGHGGQVGVPETAAAQDGARRALHPGYPTSLLPLKILQGTLLHRDWTLCQVGVNLLLLVLDTAASWLPVKKEPHARPRVRHRAGGLDEPWADVRVLRRVEGWMAGTR